MKLEYKPVCHPEEYRGSSSSPGSSEGSSPRSVRLYHCLEPGCTGRFHRKFTLREHMKTHTGEKPFQCDVKSCGRRFSTSGNMSRHRRLHLSKQFQCPEEGCTRVYNKREKLALHSRVHMGSNAYPCVVPGCSKTFSTSGNLTRHARKHHQSPVAGRPPFIGCGGFSTYQFKGTSDGHTTDSEPINCYGSGGGGIHSSWGFPQVLPRLPSEAVPEQELLDLLQCLFEQELPAKNTPFFGTSASYSV